MAVAASSPSPPPVGTVARHQLGFAGEPMFPASLFAIGSVPTGLVVLATFSAGNAGLLFTWYVQIGRSTTRSSRR